MSKRKEIHQVEEETLITVSLWARIKHWWRTLVREEWEITIDNYVSPIPVNLKWQTPN